MVAPMTSYTSRYRSAAWWWGLSGGWEQGNHQTLSSYFNMQTRQTDGKRAPSDPSLIHLLPHLDQESTLLRAVRGHLPRSFPQHSFKRSEVTSDVLRPQKGLFTVGTWGSHKRSHKTNHTTSHSHQHLTNLCRSIGRCTQQRGVRAVLGRDGPGGQRLVQRGLKDHRLPSTHRLRPGACMPGPECGWGDK